MLESKIQSKIIKKLENEGYFVLRLIRTNKNGISDLLALRNGKAVFIEVKQPKGIVSKLQKVRKKQLEEQGFEYKIWIDYEVDYNL